MRAQLLGTRVRQVRFRRAWWSGVHAGEVQAFLTGVATELDDLAGEVSAVREENARFKAALRQWQTAVGVAPLHSSATARHRSTW